MSEQKIAFVWLAPNGSESFPMDTLEEARGYQDAMERKGYLGYLIRYIDGEMDWEWEDA